MIEKEERETNLKKRWVNMVRTSPIMERTLAAIEKASNAGFLGGFDVLALISYIQREKEYYE